MRGVLLHLLLLLSSPSIRHAYVPTAAKSTRQLPRFSSPYTRMSAASDTGLVVGLNCALQRRVAFAGKVSLGGVNRALESSTGIGGKGQGAWVATQQLLQRQGAEASQINTKLVQFYGSGDEGSALVGSLRSFLREVQANDGDGDGGDVEALWVQTASKTRICTTLVSADSGEATEIVEPSGAVLGEEMDSLMAALQAEKAAAVDGQLPGVLVMGTMPPGCPGDAYGQIVGAVAGPATKVIRRKW